MIRKHKRKVFAVGMFIVGVGLLITLGWRGFVGGVVAIIACEVRDWLVA